MTDNPARDMATLLAVARAAYLTGDRALQDVATRELLDRWDVRVSFRRRRRRPKRREEARHG